MTDQPALMDLPEEKQAYQVLARKYRPKDFDDLIGQDALVRTLSNAIKMDRLAHAFLLTGIRGVGKTTTARIIARALNCMGEDGQGGPTIHPCGTCENCTAIASDRHVDVLEMDAASRTGVGDIREIIETVQYKPVSARYKIYIIDEVHMLSNSAFNALLKTLEEPPPHVKFIFATTEIRKIPVTVLSRCQRFDLRRIESQTMEAHLANICEKESIEAEPAALAMIARAAEGSVRDALSLLDQAIAHAEGPVTGELVQQMIGLADRSQSFTLFEHVMRGDIREAMDQARQLYHDGTEPSLLLNDLLDVTHFITQLRISPDMAKDHALPEAERTQGKALADKLSMPNLTRAWQTLLKGVEEIRYAPNPMQALEMVLVRLAFMAELPPPERIVKHLKSQNSTSATSATATPVKAPEGAQAMQKVVPIRAGGAAQAVAQQPQEEEEAKPAPQATPNPENFEALVALFNQFREPLLYQSLRSQVALVRFEPGKLTLRPTGHVSSDFSNRVSHCLRVWTGRPWLISMDEEAEPLQASLHAQDEVAMEARKRDIAELPHVQKILQAFPGAVIENIESKGDDQ